MASSWPKLVSSWLQVGLSWAQAGSRWPHVASKWRQKSFPENMPKKITFRRASETVFDRFWRPTWPPREGQNFHFWGLKTVLEPSWPPGPPRDLSIRIAQLSIEAQKEWRPPSLFCFKTNLKAKQGLICDVFVCVCVVLSVSDVLACVHVYLYSPLGSRETSWVQRRRGVLGNPGYSRDMLLGMPGITAPWEIPGRLLVFLPDSFFECATMP